MNLYFNGAALDPASALTRNLFAQPATKPVFMLGDNPTINLYVTDGQGGFDADSGDASVNVWLAIGNPGAEPTGGTFRLGVSSATSGSLTNSKHYLIYDYQSGDDFTNCGASANASGIIFTKTNGSPTDWTHGSTIYEVTHAIAYNATAATVQTELNATTAIGADGVTVTKPTAAAAYVVEWNSAGNKDALTNAVVGTLTPDSSVVVSTIRAGTASVTERQLVRLTQIPAALQTTWSTITNGWTAQLDCNTRGLLDLLAGAGSVSAKLELQLVDGDGNIRTVGQVDCLVRNEVIDEESTIPTPLPSYLTARQTLLELVQNRYEVDALTGGGTALDGIVTGTTANQTVQTNTLVAFDISGILYFYRLEDGTDSESSPDVIRPDDYASSTNERVWKIQSSESHSVSSYEAISFSTAGYNDISAGVNIATHTVMVTVGAGSSQYTRVLALPVSNRNAGDRCIINFGIPASTNPTVEVRNATSGGTLITSIIGDGLQGTVCAEYAYHGSAWFELGAYYVE